MLTTIMEDHRLNYFYRSQTKLQKGNVFTSVCQEFCPHGGGTIPGQRPNLWTDNPLGRNHLGKHLPGRPCPWADTPLDRQPPSGQTPPPTDPAPGQTSLQVDTPTFHQMATGAEGTHPTGTHSCQICTRHVLYRSQDKITFEKMNISVADQEQERSHNIYND